MSLQARERFARMMEKAVFPLILLLYSLRHIRYGIDLADTAYNYANFRYMGTAHMDPMWLFSTYLATAVGHVLTLLPGGHTLLFMNLYTGLFAGTLAVISYVFCRKRLHIPAWIVFLGEFVALSLCWCPTSLLYNYLTYLLFFGCMFLLYDGLTKKKRSFLILAGALLGTNVFVRFSNLPQMALILVVWGYGIICRKKFGKVAQETGWCVLGYGAAAGIWLSLLAVRYGIGSYIEGIKRLFSMTDTASDYKASSMILGMLKSYADMGYWVLRIGVFFGAALVVCFLFSRKAPWACKIFSAIMALASVVWLYTRGFCPPPFYEYTAMLRPATLFLLGALCVCALRLLQKKTPKEEKLLAMLTAMQILLSAIGSNNLLYPSINSLFVAAPYLFFCLYRLCGKAELFPAKAFALLLTAVFAFQSIGFGAVFVFGEPGGVKKLDTKVENNAILRGVRTNSERAEQLSELSAYVTENGLGGSEVILYGNIPSLSFYLGMPSAFNPWSDLASYKTSVLKEALSVLSHPPVIILEAKYVRFLSEGEEGLLQAGYTEKEASVVAADGKFAAIAVYMDELGYTQQFCNEKFSLYEVK